MGEDLATFDVMAWNSDPTRLPAALHADFLDMFMHNTLATGGWSVHGNPIDLSKVECDSFVVGARNDHLTAWKACYATTRLLGRDSQFALSSSGHIQSLVNPPGNPKMSVTIAPATEADPDEWLTKTEPTGGSWWGPWAVVGRGALGRASHPAPPRWAVPRTRPGIRRPGSTSWPADAAPRRGGGTSPGNGEGSDTVVP